MLIDLSLLSFFLPQVFGLTKSACLFSIVIRCQGEFADVAGCHTALRSLCEIIFTCGSGNRPVICECVTDFGYPEPVRVTDENITFEEACRASAEARGAPPPVFT